MYYYGNHALHVRRNYPGIIRTWILSKEEQDGDRQNAGSYEVAGNLRSKKWGAYQDPTQGSGG